MNAKQAKAIRRAQRSGSRDGKRHADREQLFSFTRKFLLAAALTVVPLSLVPEAGYEPINRLTAFLAGSILRILPFASAVRGTHITLNGFSVNVIAECSAIHLVALLGAFIFAFPAKSSQKWIGFGAGTCLLLTVNALRIALVTLIGWQFPKFFETAHVYLGQLCMLTLMVAICLLWCGWIADPGRLDGPFGFLLRFTVFSCPLFLLWVPLNRTYMGALDAIIQWLFELCAHPIVIPRTHQLYYQTFSLVAMAGFLLAIKGAGWAARLRWIGYGAGALTLLILVLRLCNAWISVFGFPWMPPLAQTLYNLCVYALPLGIGLRFMMRVRATG